MSVEVPEKLLDAIANRVADKIVDEIKELAESAALSPWMSKAEAIEHCRLPAGTFEKYVADGTIPSHGGRSKVFHRQEVDHAVKHLGYVGSAGPHARAGGPVPLRRRA